MPRPLSTPNRARRFVLALVALAVVGVVLSRTGVPPLWMPTVHRAIRATMDAQKIPGLSVAVVVQGKPRWSSGYGLADVENHVPARADTVYRWGSVSQPVTAAAVLQLVERGKLDLDAPIQKYVPEFPVKPWPVTPRQLLSHLGGIREAVGDERATTRHYARFRDAFPVFKDDPLACEPGTSHVDSCYGYNLLGAAVETASGAPFAGYLRRQIFRPAGMHTTRADDGETVIFRRARGYARTSEGALRNSRLADLSNATPSGGLCGSAQDAVKFAAALFDGRLLSRSTLDAMQTPQRTRGGAATEFGLGWNLTHRKGRLEVWLAGRAPQVSTMLYTLPDRKFAVALLANLEDVDLIELARKIADAVEP